MNGPILYLGDTSLRGAAAYLAGLMTHAGWAFDYLPSDVPAPPERFDQPHALYILSDYPAARLPDESQRKLLEHVAAGSGLVMLGGWESFHGLGGDWDATPLADALPVRIAATDDRVNFAQPTLLRQSSQTCEHPIGHRLPWKEHPPVVGGLNRFTPRETATILLEAVSFRVRWIASAPLESSCEWELGDRYPALVTGFHGDGRTAAFASDAAPHWVGGLVDWGPRRVKAQAADAEAIEVGDLYARFFLQMLGWAGRLTLPDALA